MGLVQELAQGPRPTHFPLHSHPTNPYNLATKQRSRSQAAATSSTATSGRGAGLGDVGDREAGKKERNHSQNSTPNQTELTPDQVEFHMCVSFVKLGFPMDQEPIFDTCLPCLLSAPAPVMLAKHDKLGG